MGADYRLHFVLFFASVANGVFLGFVYDLFRISRMFYLKNKVVIFFEDLLYTLICALSFILIFYNYSNGQMRAYAFAGSIGGFCAYYFTLGKLTKGLCERIYNYVSPKIHKFIIKVKRKLYYLKKQAYTKRRTVSAVRSACKGYGLLRTGGKIGIKK